MFPVSVERTLLDCLDTTCTTLSSFEYLQNRQIDSEYCRTKPTATSVTNFKRYPPCRVGLPTHAHREAKSWRFVTIRSSTSLRSVAGST